METPRARAFTAGLSRREREVVAAVVDGLTNKEIAEEMRLSPHTVGTYLRNVFLKTRTRNRTDLVSWFHQPWRH